MHIYITLRGGELLRDVRIQEEVVAKADRVSILKKRGQRLLGLVGCETGDQVKFIASLRGRMVVLGVVIAIATVGTFIWQPLWLFHRSDFKAGNEIIARVEAFRKVRGYAPESLGDIGITDPDLRVFYRKTSEDAYIVWFGTRLGESETYDSHIKKWE